MEIYLDLVIVLNFLVDLLLILGTNRLAGFGAQAPRAALAAAVGAGYAAICFLPGFSFLGNLFWRLAALTGMSAIAFGCGKSAVRRGVLFVFLSMALGGIALGIGNGGIGALILAALGVAILCTLGFCGRPGQEKFVSVCVCYGERRLHMTALLDTGNTLRDPISGTPVLVVGAPEARKLLDLTADELLRPAQTLERLGKRGLRLIPYHAVGQSAGMLLGLRADRVEINGRHQEMIVAFAPQTIGQGKVYQALAGGIVT